MCHLAFFPNAQQGFPFHTGGLGVEAVFTRRCANVRDSSHAYCKFCKSSHFWRFQTSRGLVSRGKRGTLWHSPTFFIMCPKSFCLEGAILLHTFAMFSENWLHFSSQAQHFGDLHGRFAWQAQHFRRVVWLVFCASHCQGCHMSRLDSLVLFLHRRVYGGSCKTCPFWG